MYSGQGNYGNQGYDNQGYNNQGYDNQGYNNQGYDNQGYNNQGYNNQGNDNQGYNNQGYNNQGSNYDQGDDFDLDENMSVEQMAAVIAGGDVGLSNIDIPDSVGSRDLEGFDINQLQKDFDMMEQSGGGSDRGFFDAGKGKSSTMHQVIAGAAAWQAMKWFENKQKHSGKKVSHSTLKKFVAAFAAAKAVKYFQTSGNMQSGISREAVANQAARDAVLGLESKIADDSQPQYDYSNSAGQGEASSFDQFGAAPNSGYNNNQGGYNNHQGGYNNNQGGYNNY
ncbi:hypothetical protein BB561_003423 [Smittium simulii]|uniref:Pesticidal crystal protein cry11Bb n=1 Tax=Smittium simulii TaxID=133385 RepID=A0A2T9YLH3_9FUNG|nr:hypothetical protein BB561_003423 [Smittium simulii]